jgi:hypothetical protein
MVSVWLALPEDQHILRGLCDLASTAPFSPRRYSPVRGRVFVDLRSWLTGILYTAPYEMRARCVLLPSSRCLESRSACRALSAVQESARIRVGRVKMKVERPIRRSIVVIDVARAYLPKTRRHLPVAHVSLTWLCCLLSTLNIQTIATNRSRWRISGRT